MQIELPNVLFNSRVTQIGDLMKTKPVVSACWAVMGQEWEVRGGGGATD